MANSFGTPWIIACPAPLSMGFSRQEYWSGLPFPTPGDLPDPGLNLHFMIMLEFMVVITAQLCEYIKKTLRAFSGDPAVQIFTSTTGGAGLIPGQGIKILHAVWCSQKIKH